MFCVSVSDVAGSGVQGEVTRLSRGSAMLSAHSHATHEKASVLHEFARRIRARADVFRYAANAAHAAVSFFSQLPGLVHTCIYIVCETSLIWKYHYTPGNILMYISHLALSCLTFDLPK